MGTGNYLDLLILGEAAATGTGPDWAINVLTAGVAGDGVRNDGPAIFALIKKYSGSGIGLWFPKNLLDGVTPANYLIATTVRLDGGGALAAKCSNITLWIDSGAVLNGNIVGATTIDCLFTYSLANLATSSTTLSANATLFGNLLTLTSVTNVHVGDYILPQDHVNGTRGGVYRVVALHPGNVVEVERPILWPFVAADTVAIYANIGPDGVTHNPCISNFWIRGWGDTGGLFTGQCVAYVNLVGADNCGIENMRCAKGGNGTTLASDAGLAFQVGFRNSMLNCRVDGSNHNTNNKGLGFVAQERLVCDRCDVRNCDVVNFGIEDCVDCDFTNGNASGGQLGFHMSTETAAIAGIQSNRWVRMRRMTAVGQTSIALIMGIGASENSFDQCLFADAGAANCDVNNGAGATPATCNAFTNCVFRNGTLLGLHLPGQATYNSFTNCIFENNGAQDVLVDAAATGNAFHNCVCNNTVAGARFEVHADTTVLGLRGVFTAASTGVFEVFAGKSIVRDFQFVIPTGSDAFYVPGGILDVSHGNCNGSSNTSTIGVQTNGGVARLGSGLDFSALGASILNSAGQMSRQQIVGNAAGPAVAFNFSDTRGLDRLGWDMIVAALASPFKPPVVVKTDGVGWAITFAAGDTSTYEFWVE